MCSHVLDETLYEPRSMKCVSVLDETLYAPRSLKCVPMFWMRLYMKQGPQNVFPCFGWVPKMWSNVLDETLCQPRFPMHIYVPRVSPCFG